MQDLNDFSLNQLRDKAVELGLPKEDMGAFNTKAQVITVIKSMTAKVKKLDQTKSGLETLKEKKSADKSWVSKKDRMGKILEKQPKVKMQLPLEPNEKPGIVESWVIDGIRHFKHISGAVYEKNTNGFKWIIAKGVMSSVPQQIYEKISEEMNIIASLGSKHSIDRVDPATGKKVRDALS